MTITLKSSVKTEYETISPLSIAVKIDENQTDEVQIGIDSSLIETWFATNAVNAADNMGITVFGTTASFKMWAPIATTVKLVLFDDATAVKNKVSNSVVPMEKKEKNQGQNTREHPRKRKKMGAWMKNLTKLSTVGKKCGLFILFY